jgi:hypothetical protein
LSPRQSLLLGFLILLNPFTHFKHFNSKLLQKVCINKHTQVKWLWIMHNHSFARSTCFTIIWTVIFVLLCLLTLYHYYCYCYCHRHCHHCYCCYYYCHYYTIENYYLFFNLSHISSLCENSFLLDTF